MLPGVRIDFYCTQAHYAAHLRPVYDALPPELKGRWYYRTLPAGTGRRPTVVASYGDLVNVQRKGGPVVFMEHGVGLSYSNDHPAFAGAADRPRVELFLCPNEWAAARNRATHPHIPSVVVGDPAMDRWLPATTRVRPERTLVVVSWHWDSRIVPETRSAWPHYRQTVRQLRGWAKADRYEVAGHAHPKAAKQLRGQYARASIEWIPTFDEVMERAWLYVIDNSSTLYEFAATGRPVLVVNAPWYRRSVNHGLRFWEAIPGLQVNRPQDLRDGIRQALRDTPKVQAMREAAVASAYPIRDGTSAARAAGEISRWLTGRW